MSNSNSLVQSFEQQVAAVSAQLTADIGSLQLINNNIHNRDASSASVSEDKRKLVANIEKNFEDAKDLLEQLELEIRETGQTQPLSRLACYRAELTRIRTEFTKAKQLAVTSSSVQSGDNEEYYDEWNVTEEQKAKLLDNSDRIERTGKKLTEGYRILVETEQIGLNVQNDLNLQRETIQRSRNRLRETDEHLSRSSRIMNSMIMRSLQQRFLLICCSIIFVIVMCFAIYFALS